MNSGDCTTSQRSGWRVRDALIVAAAALTVRLAVVVWAAGKIRPTADGQYYHVIAQRISRGLGYTWQWPDGVVTYAAHYPVGYPAMLGGLYALFGQEPWVAMVAHAVTGAGVALGCYCLALRLTTAQGAFVIGLLSAFHIALVVYTPAMMTELCTGALWLAAVVCVDKSAASTRSCSVWHVAVGLLMGVAVLFRGQSALLVVPFAWLATRGEQPKRLGCDGDSSALGAVAKRHYTWRVIQTRLLVMLAIVAVSCAVFLPWIVRNYIKLGEAGVSFNGGWNLLIGTDRSAHGTYAAFQVPAPCKQVFDEAQKDLCFANYAKELIVRDPLSWLALIPQKLGATFNYCGAGGWYLHQANPEAFSERAKWIVGVLETFQIRVILMFALVGTAAIQGPCRRLRWIVVVATGVSLLMVHGWIAVIGLIVSLSLLGHALMKLPVVVVASWLSIAVTVLVHAVFFGSGRYALVVLPLMTVLAALGIGKRAALHRV